VFLLALIVVTVLALFVFGVRNLIRGGHSHVTLGIVMVALAAVSTTFMVTNFSM